MAPTRCCPPQSPRCSIPPTLWRHGTLPKTRRLMCPCFWLGQLCLGLMGYLWTRTFDFFFLRHLLRIWHCCCYDACLCFLTKLVANSGGLSRVRWLADTGRIAAADTEAVGFPLGEVEQREARRFDRDLCVHPLPAVCARDTLTNKDHTVRETLACNRLWWVLVWVFPFTGNMEEYVVK